ncbi:MAG: radical SAM family heme chaperone HemW [Treponemataceae bacterium]|nr:radical SAM family heme chaperone HemW [Spirochaetales bacterium]MDY6031567.1 radical SAM family heme chaperone HemW [Treponemataceae bacterium]
MYSKTPSLYIHIPFCFSKCTYCDFFSIPTGKKEIPDNYVEKLLQEIDYCRQKYDIQKFETVYFGGGTPSLLQEKQIHKLMANINSYRNPDSEVTFELNCDDVCAEYLQILSENGINRFSVGVQSLDDKILKTINRRADKTQTKNAIETLARFTKKNPNIKSSVDFITGLPYSSKRKVLNDVKKVIDLGINHISLYSLTLEENTLLFRQVEKNELSYSDENNENEWIAARNLLLKNGYEQYEISNFAKPGCKSAHNGRYWKGLDYVGCGCGAVSTIFSDDGKTALRYENQKNTKNYIECTNFESIRDSIENLDEKTVLFEHMMTGFRTSEGINEIEFESRFGRKIEEFFPESFYTLIKEGKLIKKEHSYKFSPDGMLFLNKSLVGLLNKID